MSIKPTTDGQEMYNAIKSNHIHRPALERYAMKKFNTLKNVQITACDALDRYKVAYRGSVFELDSKTKPKKIQSPSYY
jgi:hypothetical protein